MNKIYKYLKLDWPILLITTFFSFFYLKFISLITADLGRHLINGKHILSGNFEVLSKNFYSFTNPDYLFSNHHWFFGVITRVVEQIGGFTGLTFFNLSLYTLAFFLVVKLAQKQTANTFAVIASLVSLPLITSRSEIRPETISIFLLSLFLYLFSVISDSSFTKKSTITKTTVLLTLFTSQVVWTNSHLFFIFGPFVAGVFFISEVISNCFYDLRKAGFKRVFTKKSKLLLLITVALLVITVLNPHGIFGSLAPFRIFDNYGYRVAENQTTFFMINLGHTVSRHIYSISMVILGLLSFYGYKSKNSLTHSKRSQLVQSLILFITFAILAQAVNRVSSFFGIILIPVLAQNLQLLYINNKKIRIILKHDIFAMVMSPVIIGLVMFLIAKGLLLPPLNQIGIGNAPNIENSARFFIQSGIKGNIFNNYDIGGYLVYHLPESQKLFVDNRPEAYPQNFFEDEYIAAQKDDSVWNSVVDKYNIESIYFFRLDQTEWSQTFLHRRVIDPEWVPVFVDSYALIFVKNTDENKYIIEKYQIPNEVFGLTKLNN